MRGAVVVLSEGEVRGIEERAGRVGTGMEEERFRSSRVGVAFPV